MTGSMHHDHPAVPQRISCGCVSTGYLRSCQVDRNRSWQAVGHRWCSTKFLFFIAAGNSSDVPGWYCTLRYPIKYLIVFCLHFILLLKFNILKFRLSIRKRIFYKRKYKSVSIQHIIIKLDFKKLLLLMKRIF